MTTEIHLPEILPAEAWPWKRTLNPFFGKVDAECKAWLAAFKPFATPEEQADFDKCNFNLLTSLGMPSINEEHLRTACHLVNMLFAFDELTDVATTKDAKAMADAVMDAVRHPSKPRPAGDPIIAEIARQAWSEAVKFATPSSQTLFIETLARSTSATVVEASDRNDGVIRDVDAFLEIRRDTIGFRPVVAINLLRSDIPAHVVTHEKVEHLTRLAVDLIVFDNDLYSFEVEQYRAHSHNLIAVAMHTLGLNVHDAIAYLEDRVTKTVAAFTAAVKDLPKFGPAENEWVATYVDILGTIVRANDAWSLETPRYLESVEGDFKDHRKMNLRPRLSD